MMLDTADTAEPATTNEEHRAEPQTAMSAIRGALLHPGERLLYNETSEECERGVWIGTDGTFVVGQVSLPDRDIAMVRLTDAMLHAIDRERHK